MLREARLRDRSEQFSAETSSEIVAAILRADVTLFASGLLQHALRADDFAPGCSRDERDGSHWDLRRKPQFARGFGNSHRTSPKAARTPVRKER
jgi:hypothetical protein